VAAALLIGSLPFFMGLTLVVPVLAHATWHLYRKVITRDPACFDQDSTSSLLLVPNPLGFDDLSGCETTEQAKVYGPNCFSKGYNLCALREVFINPYADLEQRRMAEVLLMDNAATTPEQHALARSFAQQPQTVVVPVVPY
jgi:hypothetical protein